MSGAVKPRVGSIAWIDLTVEAARDLRDFYQDVAGWTAGDVDMGGYSDFTMHPPGGGDPIAGVCHARGPNTDLPAQWLIYITVADLDQSLSRCRAQGGAVIAGPRNMGMAGRCAVIRDPAGAVAALVQPAPAPDRPAVRRGRKRRTAPARTRPPARRRRAAEPRSVTPRRTRRRGRSR